MRFFKPTIFLLFSCFFSISSYAQLNIYRNNNLIVLNSDGDTLNNAWAGGFNSIQFSEIDLNLDGIMDLFAFDKTDNRIIPFINDGIPNQSSYQHAPEYVNNFPKLHDWALLRDFNCDGKMDIFTYSNGGMSIYKNTSTTTLSFTLQVQTLHSNFQPNFVNLYVSSVDIPAIDDIDGDGDLDILTFSVLGAIVEYHKNLSMETYGTCDSLTYEIRNKCWGFFHENLTSNSVTLNDTCQWNITNPERIIGGNKHSGSTLLTLDVDGNNSKDLVLGDVSFNNLVLLTNEDASPNLTKSSISSQDSIFPANQSSTAAVDLNVFPAGYYIDLNNDNIKDLVVSTNCYTGCKNSNNTWFYKNENMDNNPDFNLLNTSFLQDEMIEIGEGSKPTFFDYNADGLTDIVIGNYGDFDPSVGNLSYKSSLWLYKNIGTLSVPEFQLVDSDYVNISSLNLDLIGSQPTLGISPTFGDLDGDNDMDMIIGDYQGYLHYFTNTAGAGNTANFVLNSPQYESIDVGNFASPQLIDLDRDSLLDLIIGKENGYVSYYINKGTSTSPSFDFVTDSLGYVKTRKYTEYKGNSTPFIFKDSIGGYLMISGAKNGNLYLYGNIDGNLNGTFNLIDSNYLNIWEGNQSFINLADITNDGGIDMIMGNLSGGSTFYQGGAITGITYSSNQLEDINLFPNPTKNIITIDLGQNKLNNTSMVVTNLVGEIILSKKITKKEFTLSFNSYSNGLYFIKIYNKDGSKVFKIIKN